MKIVMVGNFKAPHSTENEWAWSYKDLGHEVVQFQENEARSERIFAVAKSADLFHYVHTHGWKTPGRMSITQILAKLRKLDIPSVGVHLDYWRGLKREKDVGRHPFWQTEYTFTADGGSNEWYRAQGINHYYLRAGVVGKGCYLASPNAQYDVIFTGQYHYHPEWSYRPQLLDWLAATYEDRFQRFAGDTPGGNVRGHALNQLYASAKIVVGDTLCLGFDHPHYFSDRLFEVTGRGGFLIFPYIEGIRGNFTEGELVTYEFGNFAQLRERIDYYLEHEDEREQIRVAGHLRTKREHTYTHRAKEMLDVVFST